MKKYSAVIFLTLLLTSCSIDYNANNGLSDVSAITENSEMLDNFSSIYDYTETTVFASTTVVSDTSESLSEETITFENSEEIIPFSYENNTAENDYSSYTDIEDEIKILLKQAENLYYDFFLRVDETTFNWEKTVTISITNELDGWEPYSYDKEYSLTGISYDSFKEALLQVFTDEFTENELLKTGLYIDYNGELCYYTSFGYEWNDCFDTINFSVANQTESEMTIIGTAHYSDPDDRSITWEQVLEYDIVLTENGWRVDSFENWD